MLDKIQINEIAQVATEMGIEFKSEFDQTNPVTWKVEQKLQDQKNEYEYWRVHPTYYFGWHGAKVLELDGRYYFVAWLEVEPPSPHFLTNTESEMGDPEFEHRRAFCRYAIVRKLRDMGYKVPNGTKITNHIGQVAIGSRGTYTPRFTTKKRSKGFFGWLLSGMGDTQEEVKVIEKTNKCKAMFMQVVVSWPKK